MPEYRGVFLSIRETAKTGLLPEHALRLLQRQGKLPGFMSGTRFYVNLPQLLRQLGVEEKGGAV